MHERPVRSTTAVDVEIDHHRLVYDTHDNGVRVLDPVGALIWSLLDGTALDELADDLSAAFDVPAAQMATDLDEFVEALERDGLLAGKASHGSHSAHEAGPMTEPTRLPNPPSP